jgi:hypothetical protein
MDIALQGMPMGENFSRREGAMRFLSIRNFIQSVLFIMTLASASYLFSQETLQELSVGGIKNFRVVGRGDRDYSIFDKMKAKIFSGITSKKARDRIQINFWLNT